MLIELYTSGHCPHCARLHAALARAPEARADIDLQLREVESNFDLCVTLGLRRPPGVVIDGVLINQGTRNPERILGHIEARTPP